MMRHLGLMLGLMTSMTLACDTGDKPLGGYESGNAGSESDTTDSNTTDSNTSSNNTGSTSCEDLELCPLCPPQGNGCGLSCAAEAEGATCLDPDGEGMLCTGGQWTCVTNPLPGDCDTACGLAQQCTEAGCGDGLFVTLAPTSGSFAQGIYTVDITTDDGPQSCTFEITSNCQGGDVCVGQQTCNASYMFEQPDDFVEILLPVSANVAWEVSLVDEVLGSGSMAPNYDILRPNGPGCEGNCISGSVAAPLADPA